MSVLVPGALVLTEPPMLTTPVMLVKSSGTVVCCRSWHPSRIRRHRLLWRNWLELAKAAMATTLVTGVV